MGIQKGLVIFRIGPMSGVLLLLGMLGAVFAQNGIDFTMNPFNITSFLGKDIVLRCALTVSGDVEIPDVEWWRDEEALAYTDINQIQMPQDDDTWLVISELRIHSLQLSDSGWYQCAVEGENEKILSDSAFLQLEGLPIFSDEPQDMHVYSNVPFNLSCDAHGPPGPVSVIWLQDGLPLNSLIDELASTPSLLQVKGLNKSSLFSCEAHNGKGVTTSRTTTIKVIPRKPKELTLVTRSTTQLEISWLPGESGAHPVQVCTVQATVPQSHPSPTPHHKIYNQNINVPPYTHIISDLSPYSVYNVRVSCLSSEGVSHWTDWVPMETMEGGIRK